MRDTDVPRMKKMYRNAPAKTLITPRPSPTATLYTPTKPSSASSTPRPTPTVRASKPELRPLFIFAILHHFQWRRAPDGALRAADDIGHLQDTCASVRTLHRLIELTGIDAHQIIRQRHHETVKAARRRTIQILAIHVVVRAMARALEADAVVAEWHLAAHMDADLIQ